MIAKVIVLPKKEIAKLRLKERWAHVQIVEPNLEYVRPSDPNCVTPLYKCFVDLTPNEVARNEAMASFKSYLFDSEIAKSIMRYVNLVKDSVDVLVVSCQMGVSRSAAVANFAIRFLSLDQPLFGLPNYRPNPHVAQELSFYEDSEIAKNFLAGIASNREGKTASRCF